MSDRTADSFLILIIMFLISFNIWLKYLTRSPTSSLEFKLIDLVRSPSPSEISFMISETRFIGFAIDFPTKNAITNPIKTKINATDIITVRLSVSRLSISLFSIILKSSQG
jgi:hypothetical protein